VHLPQQKVHVYAQCYVSLRHVSTKTEYLTE
jgi:hypothetical protein